MLARLLRLGAPLALLAVAGCDAVDCEGVQPCRDGVALRIAGAESYVDGSFHRPFSPEPGAYTVGTVAGEFSDACSFSISAEIAPTVEGVVDAGTCGERLRIDTFGGAFSVAIDLPLLVADTVDVVVTRDGTTVGTTTAALTYALPSEADTACRVETCQQARIEVPVE